MNLLYNFIAMAIVIGLVYFLLPKGNGSKEDLAMIRRNILYWTMQVYQAQDVFTLKQLKINIDNEADRFRLVVAADFVNDKYNDLHILINNRIDEFENTCAVDSLYNYDSLPLSTG